MRPPGRSMEVDTLYLALLAGLDLLTQRLRTAPCRRCEDRGEAVRVAGLDEVEPLPGCQCPARVCHRIRSLCGPLVDGSSASLGG
jgi:hypothetical protein